MRILKTLLTVLTVLLTTSLSYAQTLPQPQVQLDVLVLDHNWHTYHQDIAGPSFPRKPNPGELSMPDPPRGPVIVTGYVYTLILKNVGAKTIKVLGWDYIFIDPTSQQQVARHHFQSAVVVGKGKQRTVTHQTASPPSKVVTESALNKNARHPFTERILITCIKYKDGSVWIADSSRQGDCQAQEARRP